MGTKKPNLSLSLNNLSAVRKAAKQLGFTLTTGNRVGQGSVRRMLEALAEGEVLILCHNYDFPEDMRRDASYLRELSKSIDRENGPASIVNVINGLAAALENAATLKEE